MLSWRRGVHACFLRFVVNLSSRPPGDVLTVHIQTSVGGCKSVGRLFQDPPTGIGGTSEKSHPHTFSVGRTLATLLRKFGKRAENVTLILLDVGRASVTPLRSLRIWSKMTSLR